MFVVMEMLGIFPHQENAKDAAENAGNCIEFKYGQYGASFSWISESSELPSSFAIVKK
jgi:hypothetical protein